MNLKNVTQFVVSQIRGSKYEFPDDFCRHHRRRACSAELFVFNGFNAPCRAFEVPFHRPDPVGVVVLRLAQGFNRGEKVTPRGNGCCQLMPVLPEDAKRQQRRLSIAIPCGPSAQAVEMDVGP